MSAPSWTSDDPHLSGNFAPVQDEIGVADLAVVAGRIPEALSGVYMRNGPNPRHEPITYTYPFDGDGMIHAVTLKDGKAHYRNRFVRTRAFRAEERAGRTIYAGVLQPRPVDPSLLQPGDEPGPFKNGAFINVIHHAGHLLALSETDTAYEMTMDLATLGEWTAGTEEPITMGAHNRRHPATGDLYAISYSVMAPTVTLKRIGADGVLAETRAIPLDAPTMIHDFVLTARHALLFACPIVFDLEAAFTGGNPLAWRPEMGTHILVVPLDGGAPRRVATEAFFVFHFANGFERGREIVVDYVRHGALALGGGEGGDHAPPMLHRMTIDPVAGTVRDERVEAMFCEFPRGDDRLETRPTRFVHVPTVTPSLTAPDQPAGAFNAIAKADTETGRVVLHDFGNRLVGEAVFVPDPERAGEDGGYLAVYVYDLAEGTSDLALLDAARPEEEPVALVRMPRRVPQGLHGNWIPLP